MRARTAELGRGAELSRHLIEAQEEERKRISRELHDEAGQGLMALRLCLGRLAIETTDRGSASQIEEAMSMLDGTIADLRRIIARLSPRRLNELGLLAAIRKEARLLSKGTGIQGVLDLPVDLDGVAHETEIVVYRIVQEAFHNIAKHSKATRFNVRMELEADHLLLRVEDDGVGFVSKPNFQGSFGLLGMRERIAALGGAVRIRSRQGRGTRIRVSLPVIRTGEAASGQRGVELEHQEYGSGSSEKQRKATVFRGLIKPISSYRHADQVHSS
jgi:two-component system sensor histidine kinase UhpB